jgi:hypothetical protein
VEDEKPVALDEETGKAFGNEVVVPTPVFAEAPFFKVGQPVKRVIPSAYPSAHDTKGCIVKAVAWSDRLKSHCYKLESTEGVAVNGIISEATLTASTYTVNDIIRFTAFGSTTTRTIKDVLINDDGIFSYAIAGGFLIRDEDIIELVARR